MSIAILGCKPLYPGEISSQNDTLLSVGVNKPLDTLLDAYRTEMQLKMNEVIGYTDSTLTSFKPESPLGNFVADVLFEVGFEYACKQQIVCDSNQIFSLFNFGGLRMPVTKGEITLGDVYELMPFDNGIVILDLAASQLDSMLVYMVAMQGQPLSNCWVSLSMQDSTQGYCVGPVIKSVKKEEHYYIITSDYLAGGGDKMNFLKQPIRRWDTGILVRDAIVDYIQKRKKLPYFSIQGRVTP